jgi:branched-subunit amino acid aminotransferase/4-amino-4-deoxychorismate lyase
LIDANKVIDGRARITILAGADRNFWTPNDKRANRTDLLIITGDSRKPPKPDVLSLTVSPIRINTHSPLAGVKTVNYLDHLLAWEEAHHREFDEAVMMNERGEVVGAAMANIFWVKHGTLHTPALVTGAMAGTTRALVLQLATQLSIPHLEDVQDLAHLGDADELFLTSSGLGLEFVTMFDFHHYIAQVGSVGARLRDAFHGVTHRAD